MLPGSGHYEGWDLRMTPLHRFGNLFTAPVKPIGEGKQEWDIFVLLTKKIQERAIARGISSYQDGPYTRDLHTIHDLTPDAPLLASETPSERFATFRYSHWLIRQGAHTENERNPGREVTSMAGHRYW